MASKITAKLYTRLYDHKAGCMQNFEFDVTLDLTKIPVTVLQRARTSNAGKAKIADGALTITRKDS